MEGPFVQIRMDEVLALDRQRLVVSRACSDFAPERGQAAFLEGAGVFRPLKASLQAEGL